MKRNVDNILNEIERIDELMGNKSVIEESSLSRVWSHSEKYDIAIVTAFRSKNINCLTGDNDEHEFTKGENLERNKDLLAVLLQKGYGATKIKGSYIEHFETPQAIEVAENSFFVVNRNNDDQFFDTIIKLGKYFCQDSVLLKQLGEPAYLYGTNESDFPGLDSKVEVGQFKGAKEAEFMSRVKNRPFHFSENYNVNSRYIISQRANKIIPLL
jgi:hypothetical protein